MRCRRRSIRWRAGAQSAQVPHTLVGDRVSVPAISSPQPPTRLRVRTPGTEATLLATDDDQLAVASAVDRPHLAFVNGTAQAAMATLDRVASVATYNGSVAYATDGLSQALKAVAGAMVRGIGTKVFWVQIGGFDTHATQNTNAANAGYANLMGTINTSLLAFYNDMRNQGLLQDTVSCSSPNSAGASPRTAAPAPTTAPPAHVRDGRQRQGRALRHRADLNPFTGNPTLENSGGDVTYETTSARSTRAIIDNWLGANSVSILGGDFRKTALSFI